MKEDKFEFDQSDEERISLEASAWIAKLDEFLKLSEHELLDHAGKISAEQAKTKAELEYQRYRMFLDTQPRPVDADFEQAIQQLPQSPAPKPSKGKEFFNNHASEEEEERIAETVFPC